MWGLMIVVLSSVLSWIISPLIEQAFANYIEAAARGRFIMWVNQGLTTIIFFVFAILLTILTSKSMVNRVLELSLAAKEIAKGNFSVRVSEVDRHDEVYQLALDFNRMAEQLQRNEYMRRDFISNVSHEIKTPLSVINGYVDLLTEDPDAADRLDYLDIISRESHRLLRLSQNMLQISQLDNASINVNLKSFRLDEQLRQVILLLEPRWAEKNIDLEVDIEECLYTGYEELLVQVWMNLLDNSIKFTQEGGQICVQLRQGNSLSVTIADNGSGMDEPTQQRIYEQFYQGDRSRRGEGAGLGMAIVRRIVDLHHGEILIRSSLGAGTSITINLPNLS